MCGLKRPPIASGSVPQAPIKAKKRTSRSFATRNLIRRVKSEALKVLTTSQILDISTRLLFWQTRAYVLLRSFPHWYGGAKNICVAW